MLMFEDSLTRTTYLWYRQGNRIVNDFYDDDCGEWTRGYVSYGTFDEVRTNWIGYANDVILIDETD